MGDEFLKCLHLSLHHYLPPSVCPPLPASICLSTTTCLQLSLHHYLPPSVCPPLSASICLSTTTCLHLSTTTCLHLSVHHYLLPSVCPPLPASICLSTTICLHLSVHHYLPPSVCPPLPASICLSTTTFCPDSCFSFVQSEWGCWCLFTSRSVGVFGEKSGLLPWMFRLPWGFGYWTDDCIEAVMVLMFWQ